MRGDAQSAPPLLCIKISETSQLSASQILSSTENWILDVLLLHKLLMFPAVIPVSLESWY